MTFLDLVPGTYYEVLLYTVVERTAGAERVSSQPFQFSLKTGGCHFLDSTTISYVKLKKRLFAFFDILLLTQTSCIISMDSSSYCKLNLLLQLDPATTGMYHWQ